MKTDGSEVYRLLMSGLRDPAVYFDPDALLRLGPVSEVQDNTRPDYVWESFTERPVHDLLACTVRALRPGEDDPDRVLKEKALYYALDALLSSGKKAGEEALR